MKDSVCLAVVPGYATSSEFREDFKAVVGSYRNVSVDALDDLHGYLTAAVNRSRGDLAMAVVDDYDSDFTFSGSLTSAFFYVRGKYFEKREAVSFNRDGFIGVAGWAGSKNAAPILEGLHDWLNAMRGELIGAKVACDG